MNASYRLVVSLSALAVSPQAWAQHSAPFLAPLAASLAVIGSSAIPAQAATYPRIEAAFQLPTPAADPFDYQKTDVQVQIRRIGGATLTLPAFFDGGATWRVRHTPTSAGQYQVGNVTLNGRPILVKAQPSEWRVSGAPNAKLPGLVRLTAGRTRFAFEGGAPYYPLGHNQAWRTGGLPDIPQLFDKMGAAGENWSRVWMNHWDGKNLDWTPREGAPAAKPGPFGTLSLDVARRWDGIVSSADRNGIPFQLVFQHHGQYSSQVNPNWGENPYNVANGGFLRAPNDFFTNAQAKNLTKRKIRYSIARYGYSPAILAWELFNEVQFTDSGRANQWDAVAAWHREMADFIRAQDPYRHLVTTSSSGAVPLPVWAAMDYYQEHTYPADVITSLSSGQDHADWPRKPGFVGEFGPSGVNDPTGVALHAGVWASLMSVQAGAAQFWTWDDVERNNLYGHFRGATTFVKASGLASRTDLKKVVPTVSTVSFGDLSFGPGGDWGTVKQFDYQVTPDGPPAGSGSLSRFLQGQAHREMVAQPLSFRVDFARPGQFVVQFNEVSSGGAHIVLGRGDQKVERDFPAATAQTRPQGDAGRLAIDVPAGAHLITLQNTGADWAAIQSFTLTGYAPVLGAYGVSDASFAAAWVYHRENISSAPGRETGAATGRISLSGLRPGRYRATWWDTLRGAPISPPERVILTQGALTLATPAISRDAGLFVTREAGNAADIAEKATAFPVARVQLASLQIPAPAQPAAPAMPAPTPQNYRDLQGQTEANLRQHVLDQWFPRAVSTQFGGGFDQNFTENWTNTSKGERSLVYQARLTWLASQAALRYPAEAAKWKAIAAHGADFLRTQLWDAQFGGFYWEKIAGAPTRAGEKHVYGNAFAIYALVAAYRATGDARSLQLAKTAFSWIDSRARDAKNRGYFEALTREDKPILAPPSPDMLGDLIGTRYGFKSMNTHIHLLEAFAALYEIAPEKKLKSRLSEVFLLVRDTITISPPGALNLHFRPDWKPLPEDDSFGHDIETAFLLVEAARALGMPDDAKTWVTARALVDHTLEIGLDPTNGGFYDAGGTFGPISNPSKIWWVQAEALNALLLMHKKYGAQTPKYWNAFVAQWNWIQSHQIDRQNGGWLASVSPTGVRAAGAVKSDGWTEGYHQGRALLGVSATLSHLSQMADTGR